MTEFGHIISPLFLFSGLFPGPFIHKNIEKVEILSFLLGKYEGRPTRKFFAWPKKIALSLGLAPSLGVDDLKFLTGSANVVFSG